jgi:hypothetical protein
MKKITLLLITIFTLSACSSDDDNDDGNSPNIEGYYFNATYNSENYIDQHDLIGEIYWNENDCVTSNDLWRVYIGQIETSSFFLDANLMYFENFSDFENTDIGIRDVVPSWWYVDADCYENLELMLDVEINDEAFIVDVSAENFNKINSISMVSEDNQEKIYSVEGEYSAYFVNPDDNSTLRVVGSYRTPLHLLK